jgi:hypothetical protein
MGREILRLRMLAIKNRVAPSKGGLVTAPATGKRSSSQWR